MSCEPLVSIVVPVYEVEKYLDECIDSIINQTYNNIQIIIIDDGSTDACPEICDTWATRDSRIIVKHQANGGLSQARNTGLEIAEGKYVLFVDSDDLISRSCVETVVKRAEKDNSDVVLFQLSYLSEDGSEKKPYERSAQFPKESTSDGKKALEHLFREDIYNYAQLRLTKKQLYSKIRFSFPAGKLLEDMASTYLVLGNARCVSYVGESLYLYRRGREGAITSKWSTALTDAAEEAFESLCRYINSKYPDLKVLMENYAIKFLIWCYMQEESMRGGLYTEIEQERDRYLKRIITKHRKTVRVWDLNTMNKIKLALLSTGALRFISKRRCQ